ncbi:MAG: Eco57I restriction-modification methylase domain-containing protein, partial [Gemmatimonadaceae bacterium]|nr:Eco57I restriction-modification methylase domain-containing protein [Gemmatimonadaceae bacterium]
VEIQPKQRSLFFTHGVSGVVSVWCELRNPHPTATTADAPCGFPPYAIPPLPPREYARVTDPTLDPLALDWQAAFPEVFTQGGFDVVVGNPPYVRAELLSGIKPYLEEHYGAYHGQADLYVYFFELGLRLLRPGGRLSYIVTNKWMKTGYAEPLRRMLADKTWVEAVVDLGHARQVFPDADVFPSIVLIRKPDSGPEPKNLTACVIPRDKVRLDGLATQIEEYGIPLPRKSLGGSAWALEPPALEALYAKMRSVGTPLGEYLGNKPLRGLMTGYNDAYVISTAERDAIVAKDPASAALILPCLRGQDLRRWSPAWADLWMIVMKSSGDHQWPWTGFDEQDAERIFANTYPGLYEHFKRHEEKLRTRRDKGRYWWELRSCDYYTAFERPKILYTDITWRSAFCLAREAVFFVNTVCMWPTDDLFLLGVMNSPLIWSYMWRNAQHGKDEALRLFTAFLETVPIPPATAEQKALIANRVERLLAISTNQQRTVRAFLDWLAVEFGVEKPGSKLAAAYELSSDEFVAEVRQRHKGAFSSARLAQLRAEYNRTIAPLRHELRTAAALEREISDAVNTVYGLTEEEIDILWRTAPPRMPISGGLNVPVKA